MKTNRIQKTLAVALVAGMTAAGSALAWGPGDCAMGGKGNWGGRMGNATPEQMQERMDARRTAKFERLENVLSLQEAQKPAWDTFKAAMQDDDKQLPQLKEAYDFARRSGIEGTPSLIVAGRYRILGNSYESLLANARSVALALAPKKPSPAGAGKPAAASRSATPARP